MSGSPEALEKEACAPRTHPHLVRPHGDTACGQPFSKEERMALLRCRLAMKLAAKSERVLAPAPRYDDVFFEGVRWLEENG